MQRNIMHLHKFTMNRTICRQQFVLNSISEQGIETGIQFKSYLKGSCGVGSQSNSCPLPKVRRPMVSYLENDIDSQIKFTYSEWKKKKNWRLMEPTHAVPHKLLKLFGNIEVDVTVHYSSFIYEMPQHNVYRLNKPRYELIEYRL